MPVPVGRAWAQAAPAPTPPFDPAKDGLGMLLVGGIVLVGGLLEIHGAFRNRRVARHSGAWPRADGVVVGHDIRRSFLQGFGHVPRVRYGFEAAGQRWEHDHVVFGGHRGMKRAEAERVLRRYPLGTKVQVIHDPGDPRICALEADSAFTAPLAYGVAMVATGIVVIGAVFAA